MRKLDRNERKRLKEITDKMTDQELVQFTEGALDEAMHDITNEFLGDQVHYLMKLCFGRGIFKNISPDLMRGI